MPDAIRTLRLLPTEPRPAAWHIALSAALLEAHAGGQTPDTIRFPAVEHPCILLGANQLVTDVQRGAIELQRRITGGPALYAGPDQFAWELVVSRKTPTAPILEAFAHALRSCGYPVDVKGSQLLLNRRATGWLTEAAEKQALLLQGFVYVRNADIETSVPAASSRVSLFESGGGRAPAVDELRAAFETALVEKLAWAFDEGALAPEERALLASRVPEIRSEAWVASHRAPEGTVTDAVCASVKATVSHGTQRNQIQSVVFSGEFSSRPRAAIRDLERELSNTTIDEAPVRIEDFFTKTGAEVPGAMAGDFFMALSLAFMKRRVAQSAAPDPQDWKKEIKS